MHVIETDRLLLRTFEASDVDGMFPIFGDAEVMRFSDGVKTGEWIVEWLRRCSQSCIQNGFGPWAVIEKGAVQLIGYCGLFNFPNVNGKPEVELGYRLRRSVWGKGYATEAATAVRNYAFDSLGIKRLISLIDPNNLASIRVAEKLEMVHEADVMLEGYSHPDRMYVIERVVRG